MFYDCSFQKHFDFPLQIFMDWYSESNQATRRRKPKQAKKLQNGSRDFHCQLDSYVYYGSGPKQYF